MPLRETRRFKTRGPVVSFGDIMLPLVGVLAVGLLVVAGKLFFAAEAQPNSPLPVAPPTQERRAQADPRPEEKSAPEKMPPRLTVVESNVSPAVRPVERAPESLTVQKMPPPTPMDILAVPYDGKTGPSAEDKGNSRTPASTENSASSAAQAKSVDQPKEASQPKPRTAQAVQVVMVPKKTAAPAKTAGNAAPAASQTAQKKAEPQTAPAAATPWMVQVGAYSTKAAAESIRQQAVKSGFTASIASGRSLHRVLVQGGATREEALALATRLSKMGFQGAFIVPPR